jgi:transposase
MVRMLHKELQVEIQVLHRQGKGIRAIARETGIARNTIRAILAGTSDGQYGPRERRTTKIDAHKNYLQERIAIAGKIWLPATVLLRETRASGYEGGITQLKEYLREIRPAAPDEPIMRFETEPGLQLQIDFVVFRRGELPLRAFTAELGFSRFSYVEFTSNESGATLIACLERALQYFGGVPMHVLCDNPKTIVIERNAQGDGIHRYQKAWLDFVKHYGLHVKLCSPYRAQTKGKIERFHRYLRESFFNPLQAGQTDLVDVALANREVRPWLDEVANCRVHATLKQRPVDRFAMEARTLRPLPLPYGGRQLVTLPAAGIVVPMPVESLQHPLSVYDRIAREVGV